MPDLQSELDALAEEESRATARAMAAADDALRILEGDLPAFVAREVKKAFLASARFADSLSDEVIGAIKADIQRTGDEAARSAVCALQGQDPWLAGVDRLSVNEEASSFEDNPVIWAAVSPVEAATVGLLERHGFPEPDGGFDVRYRQPAFFVGGRHMKSVAEHYWRALRDVREMRRRRDQLAASARAEELSQRWDAL